MAGYGRKHGYYKVEVCIMGLFEELKALGVNIDEGLNRIGGNEKLYTRLLGSFVKSMKANEVTMDFDTDDLHDVIEKTHTIKGTSGNMSITPIYESYSEIVKLLRMNKPLEAKEELAKILPVQEEILQCIKKYMP